MKVDNLVATLVADDQEKRPVVGLNAVLNQSPNTGVNLQTRGSQARTRHVEQPMQTFFFIARLTTRERSYAGCQRALESRLKLFHASVTIIAILFAHQMDVWLLTLRKALLLKCEPILLQLKRYY